MKEVQSLRQRSSSPVVIHCSAGVGRSGVLVLVDMLMGLYDFGEVCQCYAFMIKQYGYTLEPLIKDIQPLDTFHISYGTITFSSGQPLIQRAKWLHGDDGVKST